MGDTGWILKNAGRDDLLVPGALPWFHQWMPNTACSQIANEYGLRGPRLTHSVACASGLVDILSAVRTIRDDQADIALVGSADCIQPLFAAGFDRMKVLAQHEDPKQACRPFDSNRNGFVLGEGAAMFVIERLSHALARNANIYAEILSGRMLAEAHHVTGLDQESEALARLLSETMREAHVNPGDLQYINAHGTGTAQNDVVETRGIRLAMGDAADHVAVSATKSMLGHLINAAGSVELAITTLALRDGYAPPTLNLTNPDPACNLDCIPLVGRRQAVQHAMKISVAFGGHLVAVVLRRWEEQRMSQAAPAA
jgi:3-oxoacyl-(acyl-carrier-protein) synthase